MTGKPSSIKELKAVPIGNQRYPESRNIGVTMKLALVLMLVALSASALLAGSSVEKNADIDSLGFADSAVEYATDSYRMLSRDEAHAIYYKIKDIRLSIDSLHVNFGEYYQEKAEELAYDVSPKSQFETSIEYYRRASKSLEVYNDLYISKIQPLKTSLNKLLQKPIRVIIPSGDITFKSYDADASTCYFKVKDGLWGNEINSTLDYIEGAAAKELVGNLDKYTFFIEYRCNHFDIFKPASMGVLIDGEVYYMGQIQDKMTTMTDTDRAMQIYRYNSSGNAYFVTWSDDIQYNRQGQLIVPYSMRMVDLCNPQGRGYMGLDRDYPHYTSLRSNGVNISNDLRYLGTGGRIERLESNSRVSRLIRPTDKAGSFSRGKNTVVIDDLYGKHHFVIFSPDSRFVLIGSSSALIYNPETGQKLHDFEVEALNASWSEDGSRIILQTRYEVLVYNAFDLSLIKEYQADKTYSRISADGKWVIASNLIKSDRMMSKYIFASLEKENLQYSRVLPIPYAMSPSNVEIVLGKYLLLMIDGRMLACDITDDYSELQEILKFGGDFNVIPSGNSIVDSRGGEYFLKLDQVY